MIPSSYIPDNEMAKLSARMLIEIGAIGFNSETPFKLASDYLALLTLIAENLYLLPELELRLWTF